MNEFEQVKSIVSLREYVTHILGAPDKTGSWRCPFHEDKSPSFSVKGKAYKCFAGSCGVSGDVVSFAAKYHNMSQGKAKNLLKEWANITTDSKPAAQEEKKEQIAEALPEGWRHFIFRNAAGEEVGAEIRKDFYSHEKRKVVKTTRLYHKREGKWVNRALDAPRPLYRLDDQVLGGSGTLYVVEGAKCAEAAIEAGARTTTWMGGTNALHLTDFAPLIQLAKTGTKVALLSDADAPGRKAMRRIRKQLINAGVEEGLEFYSLPGTDGDDIADLLEAQGSWSAAFSTVQERCPDPTKLPPIIADDMLDSFRNNREFEVLGYQDRSIVAIRKSTGKVVHLPSKGITDGNLNEICPEGYFWTMLFENPMATLNQHSRREAHRALHLVSEERGLWQAKNQTGRGLVRIPGEGFFFHFGDRVEPVIMKKGDKAFGIGEKSNKDVVFVPRPPLRKRPGTCRPAEFKLLNDELNKFSWRHPYGATLMLAWVCAALIGGATYRPHLRLVSAPDMGKNWLMDAVVLPILGDMYNDGGGDASAAGISAKAKGDALPFIINEANPNSKRMREKQSDLQNLLLGSYDPQGTPILRATQDGEVREAYVRSSFLMASNQIVKEGEALASRTFQLSMTGGLSSKEWRALEDRIDRLVESYAPGIRGLMMSKAEEILADLPQATKFIQDDETLKLRGRVSRNVALLAVCHASIYPHEVENRGRQILFSARQIVTAMGEQIKIKQSIVGAIVSMRDHISRYSLREAWAESQAADNKSNIAVDAILRRLRIAGAFIRKEADENGEEHWVLFVYPGASELQRHLSRDEVWGGVDILSALKQEPGNFNDQQRFGGDPVTAICIPLPWELEQDEIAQSTGYVSPYTKDDKVVSWRK